MDPNAPTPRTPMHADEVLRRLREHDRKIRKAIEEEAAREPCQEADEPPMEEGRP